jgi:sulfide dehydrogenase [flavocytochrome c] flavoprotein subunit
MPKSGFAANSHGKACAAALASLLAGHEVKDPIFLNTCYSLLAPDYGISINGAYLAGEQGIVPLYGSGGTSPLDAPPGVRRDEAKYAEGWYASMIEEMFG